MSRLRWIAGISHAQWVVIAMIIGVSLGWAFPDQPGAGGFRASDAGARPDGRRSRSLKAAAEGRGRRFFVVGFPGGSPGRGTRSARLRPPITIAYNHERATRALGVTQGEGAEHGRINGNGRRVLQPP